MSFLPINRQEMKQLNMEQVDFVYVIGDAYVDHPSFGPAIISRLLQAHGYTVGILSQPDWKNDNSITEFGEPRLGFLVSAGNMDSMVNHYTVAKKRRSTDAYTPGGIMGKRPDYACVVYGNLIRKTYKQTPIILGGVEASLRRLAHYDYWSNKVKRSVLLDSGADMISYGMGERSIIEIADALRSGLNIKDITYIDGTVFKTRDAQFAKDAVTLPDFSVVSASKEAYAKSFYTQYQNADPFSGKRLCEEYDHNVYVIQNPPAKPLSQMEMDDVYDLPYERTYHPSYKALGGVPALQEVQFSLVSNRGCFGGCNFCALTFHQGRILQTRSHESILNEAKLMTGMPDFKGYIHDVGGPTANFRQPACKKQLTKGACTNQQCLFPKPCKNMEVSHKDYLALLRKLRELPKVKKVFIRSGIRFDYLVADKDPTFLTELCKHHVSGQLKVAPEHVSDRVLKYMGKPEHLVFQDFTKKYQATNKQLNMQQFMVPYLMSSHPGSTIEDAIMLAEYLRDENLTPEQVQDFYPTPSTISTCMYYTGIDPRNMQPVTVATNPHEKAMQRALIQYKNPANYDLVKEALLKCGRKDLIGFEKHCLIPPRKMKEKQKDGRNNKPIRGKNETNHSGKKRGKSNPPKASSQASKRRTK